jgi:hypothetical protein
VRARKSIAYSLSLIIQLNKRVLSTCSSTVLTGVCIGDVRHRRAARPSCDSSTVIRRATAIVMTTKTCTGNSPTSVLLDFHSVSDSLQLRPHPGVLTFMAIPKHRPLLQIQRIGITHGCFLTALGYPWKSGFQTITV